MADVHEQVDHLNQRIDSGAEETKLYLNKLKKKVEEYDSQHKLSETASEFLQSGIDSASSSVDELKHIGAQLHRQSKTVSGQTIETAQQALGKVKDSIDELQDKAREYDRKFVGSTGASVATGIENVVNATRQRTTDAIEMANEQAMRVMEMIQNVAGNVAHGAKQTAENVASGAQHAAGGVTHTAKVATGEVLKAAEKVDEKIGVTPAVSSAMCGVTDTVKKLDKRMHVTETATKIDTKITGGLATNLVHKGVELMQESIDYVTETLQQAKIAASQSPTMQMAEERASGAAERASDTTGAVQEKVSSAKDTVMGKVSDTTGAVQEKSSSAKDTAIEATGMSGSGETMMEKAKGAAGQAGDMASEGAEHAKEGAQYMTGQAMEKGQQVKEGVKDKGQDIQEKGSQAMQKGYDMKESVKEKGSQALQQGHDMKETAKEKGSQAMGKAQDKGSQAKEKVKEKGSDMTGGSGGGSSSSSGGGTMHSMKEQAGELGTAAKEATMGMSAGDSATDVRHKEEARQQQTSSAGDDDLTQQASKSAMQAVEQAKEKMADVMSRQKSMMKDTTKA